MRISRYRVLRTAFVVVVSLATIGIWSCRDRESEAIRRDLDDPVFRYRFVIRDLDTSPDVSALLTVALKYDGMPDLHLESVSLEYQGREQKYDTPVFGGGAWAGRAARDVGLNDRDVEQIAALFDRVDREINRSPFLFDTLPFLHSTSMDVTLDHCDLKSGVCVADGLTLNEAAISIAVFLLMHAITRQVPRVWDLLRGLRSRRETP